MSTVINFRPDRFKQSIAGDIRILCSDGKQLAVKSNLLTAHSAYFKTLITGSFQESVNFSDKKCLVTKLDGVTFKTLTAITSFFDARTLPEKTLWEPEELISLNESLPFFQLARSSEQRLRDLLVAEIKTNQLKTPAETLSWYAAGLDSDIHFPGLKEIALENLKGPFSGEQFLGIISAVSDPHTFSEYDRIFFLDTFVPDCTIQWENVTPDEKAGIYLVMSKYGTFAQREECIGKIALDLCEDQLFSILQNRTTITGITPEDTRRHCLQILSKRIPDWFNAIQNDCKLDSKSSKIQGKRNGLLGRVKLDPEAKKNLERFAKLAPELDCEQTFHLHLTRNSMPTNLYYWVKAQLGRLRKN